MNDNNQPNNKIWEEKKLSEPKSISGSVIIPNQGDITNEIKTQSNSLVCSDIGNIKHGIVYKIVNTINHKVYIGITTNSLYRRIQQHVQASRLKNRRYIIHKAINKYGIDNFTVDQIDLFKTELEGRNMEIEYIKSYNSFYLDGHGYNMTRGGEGTHGFRYAHTEDTKRRISLSLTGKTRSEEAKRNMSIAQQERNKWYVHVVSKESAKKGADTRRGRKGTPHTPESKEKLRRANLGKHHTLETRKKIGQEHLGKVASPETRKKMRDARLGMKFSDITKHKLSISHIKNIPPAIDDIIKNYIRNNLKPYKIEGKLRNEHDFKISRETIKKRYILKS